MKSKYLIALISSLTLLLSCDSSKTSSTELDKQPDAKHLSEQDPVIFAKSYINDVQNQASIKIYGGYLPEKTRKKLEEKDKLAVLMYENALSENTLLSDIKPLKFEVTKKNEGNTILLRYKLPATIDLKTAYPHSPLADQGWVINTGQITLIRENDRWNIAGHSMDGEKKSP